MNCRRARADIALWAGNDLDEFDERQLRRHIATCPHCREYAQQMTASLQMLERAGQETSRTSHKSLWPSLSATLAAEQKHGRARRFSGWVPAVAVAALCLAMVSIVRTRPPAQPAGHYDYGPIPAIHVGDPAVGNSGDVFGPVLPENEKRILGSSAFLYDPNLLFLPRPRESEPVRLDSYDTRKRPLFDRSRRMPRRTGGPPKSFP